MLGIDNNSRQAAVDLLEWDFAQKDPTSLQTVPVGQAVTPSGDPSASESGSDAGGADADDNSAVGAQVESGDGAETSDSTASSKTFGVSNETLLPVGMLLVAAALLLTALITLVRLRRGKIHPLINSRFDFSVSDAVKLVSCVRSRPASLNPLIH